MKILDGRKNDKVPEIIEVSNLNILDAWTDNVDTVYCLEIDGKYVPCVKPRSTYGDYEMILCAEYKSRKYVEKYVARFYEHAKRIESRNGIEII